MFTALPAVAAPLPSVKKELAVAASPVAARLTAPAGGAATDHTVTASTSVVASTPWGFDVLKHSCAEEAAATNVNVPGDAQPDVL